jgi:hypothetical protein
MDSMAMMKITLEADEGDVKLAEELSIGQNTTLNDLFKAWLREMAERQTRAQEIRALMEKLRHVNAGRKFTRDEMNER